MTYNSTQYNPQLSSQPISRQLLSSQPISHEPIVLAQITDSHLFCDPSGLHHGHNVLENLKKVLQSIHNIAEIELVVFTGDLTQDHTEQSYQNFVDCVRLIVLFNCLFII